MDYDFLQIQKYIANCLDIFMNNDIFLLEVDVDERTMSHRLAFYLQTDIPELHVDCEYNREGFEIKKISNSKWTKPRGIYPDIIVHKRGENTSNILVVEIKKQGNKYIENDEIKLREFTSDRYHYKFGVLIVFYTKENSHKKPLLRWFSKGKEIAFS